MQAVILAAGRGTRLGALTRNRSKAMLPILGQPIFVRVMETLADPLVEEFIIVVSPGDKEIKNFVTRNQPFDGMVRLVEQPEPLGSGAALHCAAPYLHGDFLLSACDNLLPPTKVKRMLACWNEGHDLEAILTLMPVREEQVSSTGIVAVEGDWVIDIVEKPTFEEAPSSIASLPLYCFSRNILKYLPLISRSRRGEYELQDAIRLLIREHGQVRGLRVQDRFTLTTAQDLLAINMQYLEVQHETVLHETVQVGKYTQISTPVYIEKDTILGSNCRIGPSVYIESGCRIGDGASVRDTVILRGTQVQAGASLRETVLF